LKSHESKKKSPGELEIQITTRQNLWKVAKVKLRGNFTSLNAYKQKHHL
jgi:hypothetical protein